MTIGTTKARPKSHLGKRKLPSEDPEDYIIDLQFVDKLLFMEESSSNDSLFSGVGSISFHQNQDEDLPPIPEFVERTAPFFPPVHPCPSDNDTPPSEESGAVQILQELQGKYPPETLRQICQLLQGQGQGPTETEPLEMKYRINAHGPEDSKATLLEKIASYMIRYYKMSRCKVHDCYHTAHQDSKECRFHKSQTQPQIAEPRERQRQTEENFGERNADELIDRIPADLDFSVIVGDELTKEKEDNSAPRQSYIEKSNMAPIILHYLLEAADFKAEEELQIEMLSKILVLSRRDTGLFDIDFASKSKKNADIPSIQQTLSSVVWAGRCILTMIQAAEVYLLRDALVHFLLSPDNNAEDDNSVLTTLGGLGYMFHFLTKSCTKKISAESVVIQKTKTKTNLFAGLRDRTTPNAIAKACEIPHYKGLLLLLFKHGLFPKLNISKEMYLHSNECIPLLSGVNSDEYGGDSERYQQDLQQYYLQMFTNMCTNKEDVNFFSELFVGLVMKNTRTESFSLLVFLSACIGFLEHTILHEYRQVKPLQQHLVRQTVSNGRILLSVKGQAIEPTTFEAFHLFSEVFETSIPAMGKHVFAVNPFSRAIGVVESELAQNTLVKIFSFNVSPNQNICGNGQDPENRMEKMTEMAQAAMHNWDQHEMHVTRGFITTMVAMVDVLTGSTKMPGNENRSNVKESAALLIQQRAEQLQGGREREDSKDGDEAEEERFQNIEESLTFDLTDIENENTIFD
jgi:hypothetical protein